jgi:phosphoglycolate phosphatase-like HAD superfamily hydrolase
VLEFFTSNHVPRYVNSATPAGPLRDIVESRYPAGTFQGVFGGPSSKIANLEAIKNTERLAASEILLVGDGIDDQDAARALGCVFVGVAGGSLSRTPSAGHLVDNLREIISMLRAANGESTAASAPTKRT